MDILKLLLLFLRPGVGEDPPADDPPADPPADDLFASPDDDAPPPSDEPPAKDAAQEEAERHAVELRARAERLERENSELRARANPPPIQDADLQAVLQNPQATAQEKWKAEADLVLRQNTRVSQSALYQAQDLSDRTAFAAVALSDPTAKRYEARVEQELADMRAKGQNAPREAIYTYLLGKDMRAGKFKKKDAPKAGEPSAVNRGKLPGARSDVGARGSLTEHQKREKRLENVQI